MAIKSTLFTKIQMGKNFMIRWFVEKIYHYSTALTSWSWTWLYGKRKIIVPKKINEDEEYLKELKDKL